MPIITQKIGVATVEISDIGEDDLPSLTGKVPGVCAVVLTKHIVNEIVSKLSTTPVYEVMLGLVGYDADGGYQVGFCSNTSGPVSINSTNRAIRVRMNQSGAGAGAWPTGFDGAICVALFLKTGIAKFQLAGFGYLPIDSDFTRTITTKPLPSSPRFDTALLQSTTSDEILGEHRTAVKEVIWLRVPTTTGGVTLARPVNTVNIPPDNSPDYPASAGRGITVSFKTLANGTEQIIRGNAGVYKEYDVDGETVLEAEMTMGTAVALINGNRAMKITSPRDNKTGRSTISLLLGTLGANQQENTEAWTKTEITPISWSFATGVQDFLLIDQPLEFQVTRS